MSDATICPPEHRHAETLTCAQTHGCSCTPCRAESAAYYARVRRFRGTPQIAPAAPLERRLRALARIGWPATAVASRVGITKETIQKIVRGREVGVHARTDESIREFYRANCTTQFSGVGSTLARNRAEKEGWRSPMEWVDIDAGVWD